jgi:hypothetical protein
MTTMSGRPVSMTSEQRQIFAAWLEQQERAGDGCANLLGEIAQAAWKVRQWLLAERRAPLALAESAGPARG